MKFMDIFDFLSYFEPRFRPRDIKFIDDYFTSMIEDQRVLVFYNNDVPCMIMCYSITDDFLPYAKKDFWEYYPHNPDGKICFIEKLISREWKPWMRKKIDDIMVKKYPQIEGAAWYRARPFGNQLITVRRRKDVRDKISI